MLHLQVWVLDSNPGLLPTDRSDVARVMTEIGKIPVPLRSRDDMIKHLQVRHPQLCSDDASHLAIGTYRPLVRYARTATSRPILPSACCRAIPVRSKNGGHHGATIVTRPCA